jgi:hypothetical protein
MYTNFVQSHKMVHHEERYIQKTNDVRKEEMITRKVKKSPAKKNGLVACPLRRNKNF